jgi:hypothetical protein
MAPSYGPLYGGVCRSKSVPRVRMPDPMPIPPTPFCGTYPTEFVTAVMHGLAGTVSVIGAAMGFLFTYRAPS